MRYRIHGYTNPLGSISAPLVSIVSDFEKFYAVFPDSSIKELNIQLEDDLNKMNNLIKEDRRIFIESGEMSYIDFKSEIRIGTLAEITNYMINDLGYLEDQEHRKDLRNIVDDIIQKKSKDAKLSSHGVVLYTTDRVKKNGNIAKRIILQHRSNGSMKTAYKKNLYTNELLKHQDTKRFKTTLVKTLEELSKRYKDSSIKYYFKSNVA